MNQRLVKLSVNGELLEKAVQPRKLLSDFIREDLGLTGTHIGCEHGVCGACTILLNGQAIRSCLLFAVQVNGCTVSTVESLAIGGKLNTLQEAFHEQHALQCGFCTPGILMSMVALLDENREPTEEQIRTALSGNLCRCTGYQNIIQAVTVAASRLRAGK